MITLGPQNPILVEEVFLDLGESLSASTVAAVYRDVMLIGAVLGDIAPRGLCFRNEIPPGAAIIALRDLVRARETRLWKETGGAAGTCSSSGAGRETD